MLWRRPTLPQVRLLARTISPAEYDNAVGRWPELCPLYYMGDRRSGQELLDGFEADAGDACAVSSDDRHVGEAGYACVFGNRLEHGVSASSEGFSWQRPSAGE